MTENLSLASLKPEAYDRCVQWLSDLRGGSIQRVLTPYLPVIRGVLSRSREWTCMREVEDCAAALVQRIHGDETAESMLPEIFALTAAAARLSLGLDPRPVQLAAALAMHENRIAELATGEGKTLAAVFPAILAGLGGRGVHVMTANDYLARRDARWMAPLYRLFGLTVGVVTAATPAAARKKAYAAPITYLTARQAGFDFLRDAVARQPEELRQRPLNCAIVDEADYLLIDEARVPMVIAGREPCETPDLAPLNRMVAAMDASTHFQVDPQARNSWFTDAGYAFLEKATGCKNLFLRKNKMLLAAAHTVLHARTLLHRDKDYLTGPGGVELVDSFTGRTAPLRRWPDGIHQAVELKEGFVPVPEGRILGSITVQHFMKLYSHLSGMTATAHQAVEEFKAVYGLDVVVIPPHQPCMRRDEPDRIFQTRKEKQVALVKEIRRQHMSGRPVLVGTATVAESESLARRLRNMGVRCQVLNARHPAREARIIARAGCSGAVTISTNMAGRGVDIRLGGGDPQAEQRVRALGGLFVLGTHRHESRRMDDQLRGRSGRQGDPGGSCFFISLEDELTRRFHLAVHHLVKRNRALPAWSQPAHREVAHAQRVMAGKMAQVRRILCDYSAVLEKQRRQVHGFRREVIYGNEAREFLAESAAMYGLSWRIGAGRQRLLTHSVLFHVDRLWSDHLERLRDLRSGIHLARLAGGHPLSAYEQAAARAFARFWRRLRGAILRDARTISRESRLPQGMESRGTAATWTYLVSDDPFKDWKLNLISMHHIGSAVFIPLVVIMNLPLVLVLKWCKRLRRRRKDRAG